MTPKIPMHALSGKLWFLISNLATQVILPVSLAGVLGREWGDESAEFLGSLCPTLDQECLPKGPCVRGSFFFSPARCLGKGKHRRNLQMILTYLANLVYEANLS